MVKRALTTILLSWYFFITWEGRVTKWEFQTEAPCQEARAEVVRVLSGAPVTKCLMERPW